MIQIAFHLLAPIHPQLPGVICSSIGAATADKIARVLQEYGRADHFLIGCCRSGKLVGVAGFSRQGAHAVLHHLSVLHAQRGQGLGRALIQTILRDFHPHTLRAQTDEDAVGFYRTLGFCCTPLQGPYGPRYDCILMPPPLLPAPCSARFFENI